MQARPVPPRLLLAPGQVWTLRDSDEPHTPPRERFRFSRPNPARLSRPAPRIESDVGSDTGITRLSRPFAYSTPPAIGWKVVPSAKTATSLKFRDDPSAVISDAMNVSIAPLISSASDVGSLYGPSDARKAESNCISFSARGLIWKSIRAVGVPFTRFPPTERYQRV